MKADVFPERLREALRRKLIELECSNKVAGVIFDVEASSLADWLNGSSKHIAPEHKADVSFFVAGYLDGFMDWLKLEADASPEEARALCHVLFALCRKIQSGKEVVWGGDKKVVSLEQAVNDLLKNTLADAC